MNSSVGARASRRYSEKMSLRTVLALLLTLFLPHGASAETTPHLRILDGQLKSLFEHGLPQSPTLRALAEARRAMMNAMGEQMLDGAQAN